MSAVGTESGHIYRSEIAEAGKVSPKKTHWSLMGSLVLTHSQYLTFYWPELSNFPLFKIIFSFIIIKVIFWGNLFWQNRGFTLGTLLGLNCWEQTATKFGAAVERSACLSFESLQHERPTASPSACCFNFSLSASIAQLLVLDMDYITTLS